MEETTRHSIDEMKEILRLITEHNQSSQPNPELIRQLTDNIKKIKESMTNIEGSNGQLNERMRKIERSIIDLNDGYGKINAIELTLNDLQEQINQISIQPPIQSLTHVAEIRPVLKGKRINPLTSQAPAPKNKKPEAETKKKPWNNKKAETTTITKSHSDYQQQQERNASAHNEKLGESRLSSWTLDGPNNKKGGSIYKILAKLSNKTKL